MSSRRVRGQLGLTMIETMASLMIFSIVTLGITPLILGSVRGSALARSLTIGKNLTSESMERVRGLPLFESVKGYVPTSGQPLPPRRDVLDMYFPDTGAGYQTASKTFLTSCSSLGNTPAPSAAFACPTALPQGYSMEFRAQFVQAPLGSNPQTFSAVEPTGYSWSSTSTENPPTRLLRLAITTRWETQGRAKEFTLTTLIGERKLSPDRVRGNATLTYIVEGGTSFVDDVGRTSTLLGTIGSSTSTIGIRGLAAADQTVRTAHLLLTREESALDAGGPISELAGATTVLHAPPNEAGADQNVNGGSIVHPDLTPPLTVGTVSNTDINGGPQGLGSGTGVQVVNELPRGVGQFRFAAGTGNTTFAMNNQAETGNTAALLLDASTPVLIFRAQSNRKLNGFTTAETTALTPTASRSVTTVAQGEFGKMFLLSTLPSVVTHNDRAVVIIRDFVARAECKATANPGTVTASGSWTAEIRYWVDTTNDNVPNGAYAILPATTFNGNTTASPTAVDPLAAVKAANPVVYEDPLGIPGNDIHLFQTPTTKGYLVDWSSAPYIASTKDTTTGRSATVSINGAIRIITNQTDPNRAASALSINIGKLGCEAVDKRGL